MILMQLGTIQGDSTISGYEKWIGVDSFQFGVGRGIASSSSSGGDRDTSVPSLSEITVSKTLDISSTLLFAEACYGKAPPKCTFVWIQTGGSDAEVQVYLKVEIFNPLISGFSMSSGGDRPSESISINFTKIVINQSQFKNGAEIVKADPKGFDMTTGKAASA